MVEAAKDQRRGIMRKETRFSVVLEGRAGVLFFCLFLFFFFMAMMMGAGRMHHLASKCVQTSYYPNHLFVGFPIESWAHLRNPQPEQAYSA